MCLAETNWNMTFCTNTTWASPFKVMCSGRNQVQSLLSNLQLLQTQMLSLELSKSTNWPKAPRIQLTYTTLTTRGN